MNLDKYLTLRMEYLKSNIIHTSSTIVCLIYTKFFFFFGRSYYCGRHESYWSANWLHGAGSVRVFVFPTRGAPGRTSAAACSRWHKDVTLRWHTPWPCASPYLGVLYLCKNCRNDTLCIHETEQRSRERLIRGSMRILDHPARRYPCVSVLSTRVYLENVFL
jgi:hypothetical protein